MIEVEIKVPVAGNAHLREDLIKLGFCPGKRVKEEDTYFNSVARDFRKTDEALRIRKVTNLASQESYACMTYKGAKLDQVSMTRKELETEIASAEIGSQLLEALGYVEKYPVIKTREYFHLSPGKDSDRNPAGKKQINKELTNIPDNNGTYYIEETAACVDQVEGLGTFLELEILVAEEGLRSQALMQLEEILRGLGYTMADTTRTSYLSMLMQQGKLIVE